MITIPEIKTWIKKIIAKKIYLEFNIALLTLPMLITVILININNLNNKKATNTPTPTPPTAPVIQVVVPSEASKTTSVISPSPKLTNSVSIPCKKEIGPVSITSINDNQIVTTDPVNIDISYNRDAYCTLVWSYRLNGESWSEYNDKSISLYNLTPGNKQLEVKVKSIASGSEIILKKNFVYQSNITTTITPTISTASADQP